MEPETQRTTCAYPNFFSDTFAPAVQDRLPEPGSPAAAAVDYVTKIPTFIDTVSKDLCDDGRMGPESRDAGVSFISRSATPGTVAVGTAGLAALGIAAGGAPLGVLAAGAAAIAILPPAVEWGVNQVASFFSDLFAGVRSEH